MSVTDDPLLFNMDYVGYGLYWCRIINTTYFEYYESYSVKFIENIGSLFDVYVATLQFDYLDYNLFMIHSNSSSSHYYYEKLLKTRQLI